MSRRSSPQHLTDDRAFPVRILLRNPGAFMDVLGPGRDPHRWLTDHMGSGARLWTYRSPFVGEALALYCRSLQDAAAFLRAFPEFELEDGTASPVYSAPGLLSGRASIERRR